MEKFRPETKVIKTEFPRHMKVAGKRQVTASVPLLVGEAGEAALFGWLHARIIREGYYFCTVYRYRVWTTVDRAGMEKIEVEELSLKISRQEGKMDHWRQVRHTSECFYAEEVFGLERDVQSIVLSAKVKLFDSSRRVEVKR